MAKNVKISDLVLRDAHQSLHATRMTTADMLPICSKLDSVGYFSLEDGVEQPLTPVFAS